MMRLVALDVAFTTLAAGLWWLTLTDVPAWMPQGLAAALCVVTLAASVLAIGFIGATVLRAMGGGHER